MDPHWCFGFNPDLRATWKRLIWWVHNTRQSINLCCICVMVFAPTLHSNRWVCFAILFVCTNDMLINMDALFSSHHFDPFTVIGLDIACFNHARLLIVMCNTRWRSFGFARPIVIGLCFMVRTPSTLNLEPRCFTINTWFSRILAWYPIRSNIKVTGHIMFSTGKRFNLFFSENGDTNGTSDTTLTG